MIINHTNRFAFIHIPKCAGTSVRSRLQHLSDLGERFNSIWTHPELGEIDAAHLPLSVLRQYFPQKFDAVSAYQAFAILRNPIDRFPSSMGQHLNIYGSKPLANLSKSELFQSIDTVITDIEGHKGDLMPIEFTHFQKQSNYVFDGGRRIVDNLYKIEALETFWHDLEELLKLEIETAPHSRRVNEALVYRNTLIQKLAVSVVPVAWKYIRPMVPRNVALWGGKKMFVPRDNRWADVFKSSDIRNFVSSYYEEDIALYHSL